MANEDRRQEDMKRLVRAERMMVRWMCGVSIRDRRSSVELNEHLGIEGVAEVVRCGRLSEVVWTSEAYE